MNNIYKLCDKSHKQEEKNCPSCLIARHLDEKSRDCKQIIAT
jgi:hypothetical protein